MTAARESLGRAAYSPMKLGVWWMLGTFVAWWLFGDTSGLDDKVLLCSFIGAATLIWTLGYVHGVRTFPWDALCARYGDPAENEARQVHSARMWLWASGIYFLLYSYSMLTLYGGTLSTFWEVAQHPGDAYAAKFDIIESLTTQTGNTLLQVLILASLLQLPLGPLVGYFWGQLPLTLKVTAVAGFTAYVGFFLYIGTLQGLGFLLIGLIAGLLARQHRVTTEGALKRGRGVGRGSRVLMAASLTAFSLYMINAQADRLNIFDVKDRFQPNPTVEALAGRDFARGLAVVVHYPTHGYRGLALNLDTAFSDPTAWTEGRGSSRAVDSYWEQYVGGSAFDETFPALTEKRTGWSATTSWATVYPWLASDFSWPGVLILMFFLGRWTARMWLRSVSFHDPLALMLFSQLALFVAFVSVNNQVLISRPALLAVAAAWGLYFVRELTFSSRERRARREVLTQSPPLKSR